MTLEYILSLTPDKAALLLVGAEILTEINGDKTGGIIIETEAYMPDNDAAAHNDRGKTAANLSLFGKAGTLYVHSMRHHNLIDIVVGDVDSPGSILIRAIEPRIGLETMKLRRNTDNELNLCSGPGKLCKALSVDMSLNGKNIFDPDCAVKISVPKKPINKKDIVSGERIGISKNKDQPLRFYLKDSMYIS